MIKRGTIGVDYDGTIVCRKTKQELPHVIDTLKLLVKNGSHIILYTVRSGDSLDDAVDYLTLRKVTLHGVNDNPAQILWSTGGKVSRKVFCDVYIDDKALGTPLDSDGNVDWKKINLLLKDRRYL